MKAMLGEKIGMTQIFGAEGNVIPVTILRVTPNRVLQIKTKESDGYAAVQFGMGTRREKNIKKPQRGHMKDVELVRYMREFRLKPGEVPAQERGDTIMVSVFNEGDKISVSSISKSKGFQGVVKRYHFRGAPASHGTKHALRQPGSIGATGPQKVLKGTRMAGRAGGKRITYRGLKVAAFDADNHLLAVKGAVPGRRGTLVEIRST